MKNKVRPHETAKATGINKIAIVAFVLFGFILSVSQCTTKKQGLSKDDWTTVNKNIHSQRYVDLDMINTSNVHNLKPICEIDLNEPTWFSSGILKIGTTLYFTTRRITFAVDATNCQKIWRYVNEELPFAATSNNRGLAYLHGKNGKPDLLFRGTASGHMIALDPKTGKVVWDVAAADPVRLESFVAAPVAGDGKVYIGIATADLGVCGHVLAFDAYTGKELWRHYNVPVKTVNGEVVCDEYHGGAQWTSLTLDTVKNELYVPVSNPNPDYTDAGRPGPNLQTNSVLVFDTETTNPKGDCIGIYQAVPSDVHDWDLGTAPTLYTIGGKNGNPDRDMLAVAGKDGLVYILERKRINEDSIALIPLHTAVGTDTFNTTSPFPVNKDFPPNDTAVLVAPGSIGGAQFTGTSHDPINSSLYVGMNDFPWFYFSYDGPVAPRKEANHITATDFEALENTTGEAHDTVGFTQPDLSLGKPPIGFVTAIDDESGKVLWQFKAPAQVQAGTVPTKGGIVFAGDTYGNLYALDSKTGKELHRISTGGALNSGLISYEVGGEQYVAAEVGGLSMNPPGIIPGRPIRPEATARLKIFALRDKPVEPTKVASWPRVPVANEKRNLTDAEKGQMLYGTTCQPCHGADGKGAAYPTIQLQYHILTDVENLTTFLDTVPPPMPKLHPGLLNDKDIEYLVAYFKSWPDTILPPQPGYIQPTSGGTEAWQKIYSVMTHPRCINCHTNSNYPRQTDERHPHIYGVTRGALKGEHANRGSAIRRCLDCHGKENNPVTGVPGATDKKTGLANWHLAPLEFGWEYEPNVALDGHDLCELIKKYASDPKNDLVEHIDTDLVEWAFDPGNNVYGQPRSKPPLTHAEFKAAIIEWLESGKPCPLE